MRRVLGWLAVLAAIAAFTFFYHAIRYWLAYHTGSENTPGSPPNYNFFSGFGSDLQEITLLAGFAVLYRKVNCHTAGCWRIGMHHVADGQYVVCRKHHGEITGHSHRKLSVDFMRRQHREHLDRVAGNGEL